MAGEFVIHQEAETSLETSLHELGAVTTSIIPWSSLLAGKPFSRQGSGCSRRPHSFDSIALKKETLNVLSKGIALG